MWREATFVNECSIHANYRHDFNGVFRESLSDYEGGMRDRPTPSSSPARLAAPASFARLVGLSCGALAASCWLVACGHPATEAECQLLVDKNVELQIAAMTTPPPDVEKEKARVRAEMETALKGCVGRRITNRMLTCVKSAKTVKEVDQCTR